MTGEKNDIKPEACLALIKQARARVERNRESAHKAIDETAAFAANQVSALTALVDAQKAKA